MAPRNVAAGFGIVLVAAAVVAGLLLIGPPSEERARRLDERRLSDLRAVASRIDEYRNAHGRLPMTLADLMQEPNTFVATKDPVTGQGYEYGALDDRRYRVCAGFDRASPPDLGNTFWAHPAGYRCFELEASTRRN